MKAKYWNARDCPQEVLSELLLDALLMPFGTIDMTLPFLPLVGATDASTVYGLGAAVAPMEPERLRLIARFSTKAGEHVTVEDGPVLAHRSDRLGPRHALGLPFFF